MRWNGEVAIGYDKKGITEQGQGHVKFHGNRLMGGLCVHSVD
jgi:hypothetical protein